MAIGRIGVSFLIFVVISLRYIYCAFIPKDEYLIDCGSLTNTTIGSRVFVADVSLSSTLTTASNNLVSNSQNSVPSSYGSALFRTARVFTSPSSYSFPIQVHGRHFIRLYFFPFVNGSYNLAAAIFGVSAQDVVLLDNFQPQAESATVKEFSLNLTRDTLVLKFAPSGSTSLAFVNAIEVVSIPDNLIRNTAQIVNPRQKYEGLSGQLLETIYRINMGGPLVLPNNDTLWKTWETDEIYLHKSNISQVTPPYTGAIKYVKGGATQETAPNVVYATARRLAFVNMASPRLNLTWWFNVDANSKYLIRFHFCDTVSEAAGKLLFNVYINTLSADKNVNLFNLANGSLATALFMDYVLEAKDVSANLSISIGTSDSLNALPDAILNGLEILKIDGFASVVESTGSKKNFGILLGSILGAVAVVIMVVIVLSLVLRKKKVAKHDWKTWAPFSIDGLTSRSTGSRTSNETAFTIAQKGILGYRIPFSMLQEATNNFDENRVIGVGGFGKVYKGVLRDETQVALKRGNPTSQQGLNEFRTEIELLSRLRHRHLVSLIGYCDEKNEMILVYEYMEKGTLRTHLYGSGLPSLSWKQRLEICIGSARGLHHLHTGQAKAIIHRDIKSANILLDENLLAKVADFGLSKTGPELDQTHISTAVKGSFGYLDPEYFRRQQLTEKSDVYSFGVVLLEVLCARPVIDPTLPRKMVNLAEWGIKWLKRGELEQLVDPGIAGSIRPESLRKFGETIMKCLADSGVERPSMGDVLWNLEYALQLQEFDSSVSAINSTNRISELSPLVQSINASQGITSGEVDALSLNALSLNDHSNVYVDNVFSQLINSEGR